MVVLALLGLKATSADAAPLGMQYSETYSSPEDLAVIGKSGAKQFRLPVLPEFSSNGENFSGYDTTFEAAAKAGVRIQVVLHGYTVAGTGFPTAGEQPAWTEFAKKAVRRYGYKGVFWMTHPGLAELPVQEWEIWNEPNNGYGSAAEYGTFLKWAGTAVQEASESWGGRRTGVLFGGLLDVNAGEGAETFLANAIKIAGTSSFTGAGVHPYVLGVVPAARVGTLAAAVTGVRNVLTAAAGSAKTLAITEFGLPVQREYAVTEAEAATFMKEAVGWMNEHQVALGLTSIDYYNYRDSAFGSNWAYRSGLRDEVGDFRKTWFAFEELEGVARWPVPTTAFQANTGQFWTFTRAGGGVNTTYGMKAGTSPTIGQLGGSYEAAFQANSGNLFVFHPGTGAFDTGYGMAAGTNPSITPYEQGVIAFQSSAHQLWFYQGGGIVENTALGMEAGTSPSVAVKYNGHYIVAFHGADGNLHVLDRGTAEWNTGIAMEPGTSPAITALNHDFGTASWVVAINRLGGEMTFAYETGAITHTGYGEQPGTSPGIASVSTGTGRFEAPFQANTSQLWLYMPGGTVASTGYGMASKSGPSVIGFSEGAPTAVAPQAPYEIAFQTNASQMWTYEPEGLLTNTPYGMAAGTSPAIGPG